MSFRKKLLLLFALTVLVCVAVISISVYSTIRRSFEQADQDRANAVAAQFRSEFQRRGSEVARKVESVAASEAVQRIALDMNRGGADPSEYVGEARSLASQQRLDFLELVDTHGTILSSAQWQAKFGYPGGNDSSSHNSRSGGVRRQVSDSNCDSWAVSKTRRASGWRNPRSVCGAGCARRRTTSVCDRRRTPRPSLPLDARYSRRDASDALSKPGLKMESEIAARSKRSGRGSRPNRPTRRKGPRYGARISERDPLDCRPR